MKIPKSLAIVLGILITVNILNWSLKIAREEARRQLSSHTNLEEVTTRSLDTNEKQEQTPSRMRLRLEIQDVFTSRGYIFTDDLTDLADLSAGMNQEDASLLQESLINMLLGARNRESPLIFLGANDREFAIALKSFVVHDATLEEELNVVLPMIFGVDYPSWLVGDIMSKLQDLRQSGYESPRTSASLLGKRFLLKYHSFDDSYTVLVEF